MVNTSTLIPINSYCVKPHNAFSRFSYFVKNVVTFMWAFVNPMRGYISRSGS
ncbi:hypothetical protein BDV40DRAFT_251186, partial [Aspergillus tamarii]